MDESPDDRPDDAIEPSTVPTGTESDERPSRSVASDRENAPTADDVGRTDAELSVGSERSAVDTNWWYWVAAIPIYVGVGIVAGVIAGVLFFLGVVVDVSGGMGIATAIVGTLVVLGSIAYGLVGLVLSVGFPIGIYKDAKAIEAASVRWNPDPMLYLVVAAASVLLTAFAMSFVVAVYYLYRRNESVGVP